MKITLNFLESKYACEEGLKFFKENYKDEIEAKDLIIDLIKQNKFDYANWLITHILTLNNCVKYSIFAAELVLPIFEKQYPKDKRPGQAIEAATKFLKTNANACDVDQAADAAWAAVDAADAADAADGADAARAAADAAWAARAAAWAAVNAAKDVTWAARAAIYAVAWAANTAAQDATLAGADDVISTKILEFGLKLIGEQENENNT